jgi:hypothetical protein
MSSSRIKPSPYKSERFHSGSKSSSERTLSTDDPEAAKLFDRVNATARAKLQFGAEFTTFEASAHENPNLARMGMALFPLLSPFSARSRRTRPPGPRGRQKKR